MSDDNKQKDYIEIKKLFNDFLTWLKKSNPDTTLVKLWKRKRARDKVIQRIEANQQAEENRQMVEKEAYFLWEADGKPEGKDDYYWKLAIDKIKGKNVPTIYKPYYLLEKLVLEPVDAWIKRQASISILAQLAIIAAIVAFIGGENVRRNNEVFAAWTTITTAQGQSGSGGRIEALEFLHSRPLRFPWIGWIEEDWFWGKQEQECILKRLWGLRWERQPLVGLSVPNNAYLRGIHLCGADLEDANLQDANLRNANLQNANLRNANLQNTNLRDANLQNANLRNANLQDANLGDANLQNASLVGTNLQNAFLENVNLQNTNLRDANLQNASLVVANLQNAFLSGISLQNTELMGANLQDATLVGANLQDANLGGANLQNTFLENVNLQNTFLGDVRDLTSHQIKSTCFWEKAIYKGEWKLNNEKPKLIVKLIVKEPDNTNFIEELKKDKSSDPKESVDCKGFWW